MTSSVNMQAVLSAIRNNMVLLDKARQVQFEELATTTGEVGMVYTLIGGQDSGIQLVWNIPAGLSTHTWCWAIYPQSAYGA